MTSFEDSLNPHDIVEDDSGNVGDDSAGLTEDEDDDDDEEGDGHVTLAVLGRHLSTNFAIQSVTNKQAGRSLMTSHLF